MLNRACSVYRWTGRTEGTQQSEPSDVVCRLSGDNAGPQRNVNTVRDLGYLVPWARWSYRYRMESSPCFNRIQILVSLLPIHGTLTTMSPGSQLGTIGTPTPSIRVRFNSEFRHNHTVSYAESYLCFIGGDDLKLKVWDIRQGFENPATVNKRSVSSF